jgi:hypothetical protein
MPSKHSPSSSTGKSLYLVCFFPVPSPAESPSTTYGCNQLQLVFFPVRSGSRIFADAEFSSSVCCLAAHVSAATACVGSKVAGTSRVTRHGPSLNKALIFCNAACTLHAGRCSDVMGRMGEYTCRAA